MAYDVSEAKGLAEVNRPMILKLLCPWKDTTLKP